MRTLFLFGSVMTSLLASACMVGEDEATDATAGASVGISARGLRGCRGKASSSVPADGVYVVTTFGGPGDHQAMSCGGYADGTGWYAASRQRYGCGAHLRVEAGTKCVVVEAQDFGPDVCVEEAARLPILDVSPRVTRELFNMAGAGWSDGVRVTVHEVSASTPLGICDAGAPPMPSPTAQTCSSATLGRDVAAGTCVQNATTAAWEQCTGGAWVPTTSSAGCAMAYGFCSSATLGIDVAPRTCVQAASNRTWYQCNGTGWVKPVNVAAQAGPVGACATMHPL